MGAAEVCAANVWRVGPRHHGCGFMLLSSLDSHGGRPGRPPSRSGSLLPSTGAGEGLSRPGAPDGFGDDFGWVEWGWRGCVGLICPGAGPESLSGLERVGHDLDPSHAAAYVTIYRQV